MEFKDLTEKIIEYLDGELPPEEEKELFSALANDDELRNIMREHLTISRTIQADLQSFQPPATATLNIISTLGLSLQNDISTFNNPSSSKSHWSKAKKIGIPILIAFISSFLTFLVMQNMYKNQKIENIPGKAIVQTPPVIISTVDNSKEKLFAPESIASNQKKNELNNTNQINNESINQQFQTSSFNQIEFQQLQFPNTLTLSQNNLKDFDTKSKFYVQNIFSNNKIDYSQPRTILVTFRGIVGKSFPNPDILNNSNNNLLSNSSVGFYFTQTNNIKFGIEFGSEIFGLSYLNTKDGIEYTYEQKPNIYWGAVGVEYIFPEQIMNTRELHPFVALLAGGSQIGGPLVKGIAGLKYKPTGSNIELFIAGEGTMLFYQNQRNYYLTRKIGLTYGMSIIF